MYLKSFINRTRNYVRFVKIQSQKRYMHQTTHDARPREKITVQSHGTERNGRRTSERSGGWKNTNRTECSAAARCCATCCAVRRCSCARRIAFTRPGGALRCVAESRLAAECERGLVMFVCVRARRRGLFMCNAHNTVATHTHTNTPPS